MLDNYTLDAVFLLQNEMFYPGASAIACCMIFYLSQKHERANRDTFLIRNECKVKYQAFGRELNSHFRKDFTVKLPTKMNGWKIM